MRRIFLLLTAGIVCAAATGGERSTIHQLDGGTISSTAVDVMVTRLMKAGEVTGAAIAIFNNGKIAYLHSYGVRDKEQKLSLTVDSVMSAASFTKVAFAYVVLQLADARILDLDKPVFRYLPKPLPDYPRYSDLASDKRCTHC